MRQQILCGAALALCHAWAGLVNGGVATLDLEFADTPGAHLSFNGHNGTFTFAPDTSGHDFQINYVSDGAGSALGLYGTITGTFTIGPVVNDEAPVTGTGLLTILDGSHNLTANVSFVEIDKTGLFGTFNPDQLVNLSNIHYTGTNQDLMTLASSHDPSALLSFFSSDTLGQLQSGGQTVSAAFAGSIDPVVPEPGTMTIFLGAISLVGGFRLVRRRRQSARAARAC